jgi:predicted  nucleic acid-binding Zn-ribbon protein
MKAFVSLLLVVVLIGGVYMLSTGGCTQAQVASDKVMDKINKWLGELDVKRKDISNQITSLESDMENVRTKKIAAEVQLKQYQDKMEPLKKSIADIKSALALLQPHIKATEDVEINGKTWSPAKIQETVKGLIDDYEAMNRRLGGLDMSVKAFKQSYDLLAKQQGTADKSMSMLKEKLKEIDIKKEALDAMKTAQSIVGEGGSISDDFNKLEKDINDLFVDVETGMKVEAEKIAERERDLEASTSNVDSILSELNAVDTTAAKLEEILGTSGAGGGQ